MAAFSDYLKAKVVKAWLNNTAVGTLPTTVYLALYTSHPSVASSEVTGGSYARVAVTFTQSTYVITPQPLVTGENYGIQTAPSTDTNFTTATAPWGTITHFAICDASSAGNRLFEGQIAAPTTITTGQTFTVKANSITITVA